MIDSYEDIQERAATGDRDAQHILSYLYRWGGTPLGKDIEKADELDEALKQGYLNSTNKAQRLFHQFTFNTRFADHAKKKSHIRAIKAANIVMFFRDSADPDAIKIAQRVHQKYRGREGLSMYILS